MNKKLIVVISLIALVVITGLIASYFLFLKPCDHQWQDATCETPVTCTLCGETAGSIAGHIWEDPDCTTAKTCIICGVTAGEPNGHKWHDADCIAAKTCSVCGTTEGEPIGHKWTEANCTVAKTCDICGVTDGEPLGHDWVEATYDTPKTCSVCGETEGTVLTRPANNYNYTNISGTSDTSNDDDSSSYNYHAFACSIGGCSYPAKNVNGAYGSYCEFHSCRETGCLSTPIGGTSYCGAHGN